MKFFFVSLKKNMLLKKYERVRGSARGVKHGGSWHDVRCRRRTSSSPPTTPTSREITQADAQGSRGWVITLSGKRTRAPSLSRWAPSVVSHMGRDNFWFRNPLDLPLLLSGWLIAIEHEKRGATIGLVEDIGCAQGSTRVWTLGRGMFEQVSAAQEYRSTLANRPPSILHTVREWGRARSNSRK